MTQEQASQGRGCWPIVGPALVVILLGSCCVVTHIASFVAGRLIEWPWMLQVLQNFGIGPK